jgi:hypothetical protein
VLERNRHANARSARESVSELALHVFARRFFPGTPPKGLNCAHIWASCLFPGNSCDIRHTRALRNSLVLGPFSLLGIGIARALSFLQRGGRHLVAETDSAANQFGAPESVEDQRGTFPLFVASVCPSRICRIFG